MKAKQKELVTELEAARREIGQLQVQMQLQSARDALTGLLGLGPFTNALGQELARAARHGHDVAIARIDIDDFEAVNVEHGWMAGDGVLALAARMISSHTRGHELVCRVAGDEFALLLPQTDAAGALASVERVLSVLERLSSEGVDGLRASAGIACSVRGQDADRVFAAAGTALRSAKASGGGRVEVASAAGGIVDHVISEATVALLSAIAERDVWTGAHSHAVGDLAAALTQKLGLAAHLEPIRTAALLHDLGKLGMPDAILCKTAPLTDTELALMRDVPLAGRRMLHDVPGMGMVARIVGHVHERWDGTGYPDGLVGDEIPVGSRIIAACDAYDAMSSQRPWRPALSREGAVHELLEGAGSQFDPEVVEVLVSHVNGIRELSDR